MQVELILLAGGSGRRMAGVVADKILAPLAGQTVFTRSLSAFSGIPALRRAVIVCRDSEQEEALRAICQRTAPDLPCVFARGGIERADSVRAGLRRLSGASELVAVHDAARPLILPSVIERAIELAAEEGAAVVARPVVDTIKRLHREKDRERGRLEDLDRAGLWAMETPQVFRRDWLVAGYTSASGVLTDDAAAVSAGGHGIRIVPNTAPNPKITTPDDLAWAEFLLQRPGS